LLLLAWLGGCAAAPAVPESLPPARVIHSEAAAVGRVYVLEADGLRILRFDDPAGDDQSMVRIGEPRAVPLDYLRLALAGLAWADRQQRLAMIGLGGGGLTTAAFHALDGLEIDAVEISPVVVRLARRYFGLPRHPRYRIHVEPGRRFLERTERRFDAVILDAYTEELEAPAVMRDGDVFALIKHRLLPGGVLIVNLAVDPGPEMRVRLRLAREFGRLACIDTADELNRVVIARRDGRWLDDASLAARLAALARRGRWGFDLAAAAADRHECTPPQL
jgi:spermidine synthase